MDLIRFLFLKKVIHDYDGNIYMRPNAGGGLIFGGFDKEAKPIFHEGSPVDFENKTFKPDYDQFCKYFIFSYYQ